MPIFTHTIQGLSYCKETIVNEDPCIYCGKIEHIVESMKQFRDDNKNIDHQCYLKYVERLESLKSFE
jgi:hypothetical protein